MSQEVLVLNSDYEPLNVCHLRRAVTLIYLGKAEVLHVNGGMITTVNGPIKWPSVVKLRHHVKRPLPELKLSRRTVFARDNYTCQYCGQPAKDLTIDHVVPKRLGGVTNWENVVCSCRRCNMKKGDKPLSQSGLNLRHPPRRPHYIPYISLSKYMATRNNPLWQAYLPSYPENPAWD